MFRKLDSIRKALRCMEQWYIQGEQLPLLWTGLQQCGSKLCLTYTSKEATCMIQVTAWVHDYIIHFGMFSQVYSSQRRRLKEYRLQEKLLQGNLAYYTFKVCKTLTQPCMCNVHATLIEPSFCLSPTQGRCGFSLSRWLGLTAAFITQNSLSVILW